jgi:hypothetical protein
VHGSKHSPYSIELRNHIYSFVFKGHEAHITMDRLTDQCHVEIRPISAALSTEARVSGAGDPDMVMAITRVCRQIHADCALLPFKHLPFAFSQPEDFTIWCKQKGLKGSQLRAIGSLKCTIPRCTKVHVRYKLTRSTNV